MLQRSLSIRFIVTAVGAVAASFLLFIGVVYSQLEYSLKRQSEALESITTSNLSDVLGADLGLAAARLRFLSEDLGRRVQAIARREDTAAAIATRNVVAMAQLLGPAAHNAEVDGIVVVDRDLNVIGASTDAIDLVAVSQRVKSSPILADLEQVLASPSPEVDTRLQALYSSEELAPFAPINPNPLMQIVIMHPVRDEFGEIVAAVIAQRWIRPWEPTLLEFARITQVGITVYFEDRLISSAGTSFARSIDTPPTRFLNPDPDHRFVARCGRRCAGSCSVP